ncbi:MAG: ATP-binding protein [Clostridium sp.]|jgi:MinD superfamily P-loop ATPase
MVQTRLEDDFTLNIAVLSGKGGTGKTTVSTNLALAFGASYIDCDVEEPNGFLFLKPKVDIEEKVKVEYPIIDDSKCINCGECVDVCMFNALAKVKKDIILFQKLCHGCGACQIACKYNAITYAKREIGKIEKGKTRGINCSRGILNISEPMAVPVIRQLLEHLPNELNIIDCPPGTSCNVANTLKYADGAVLVTEPSEFGLHDLKMAVELVRIYRIPFGIIINKDNGKRNIVKEYCNQEKIPLIGTIPYNRNTAVVYSKGELLYDDEYYKTLFDNLSKQVKEVLSWN